MGNEEKTPKIEVRPIEKSEKNAAELVINRAFNKDPNDFNPPRCGFFKQFDYLPVQENFFWAVFEDETPVAAVMVLPFTIIIEGIKLNLIGLTGVGTDPLHWRKGYAGLLLRAVHESILKIITSCLKYYSLNWVQ